jgi:hypothetical protein
MTCRGYITYDDGKSWRILNAAQTCMKGRILSFDSFGEYGRTSIPNKQMTGS